MHAIKDIKTEQQDLSVCFNNRLGEDLELRETNNYTVTIKQTPKLMKEHALGLTGRPD